MTREEAIKALKMMNLTGVHPFLHWEEMMEVRDMAIAALREPEERRWIPVTERLPELGERVLCTDGVAVFEQYRVELSCVYGIWDRFGMRSPMQEVTHWMPLPEPPKEVSAVKREEITPRVTHWMPLPEPPKEDA